MGLLISIAVCCGFGTVAVVFLTPVVEFLRNLQQLGAIDPQMFGILLKVVGIAYVAELAGLICADAGNSAMGKGLQFLAVAVILWLSLPIFTALMDLIEGILGSL